MSLTYKPENPNRPPNWRWMRAREILDAGGRPRTITDNWLARTVRYRRAEAQCSDDAEREVLADRAPWFYWSERFFGEQTAAAQHQRAELEGRLLAAEPVETIASKLGTTAKVIDTYSHVFFDVADRLGHSSYILNHVVGPAIHTGIRSEGGPTLWRLFGYIGGSHVLDAITTTATAPEKPTNHAGVSGFLDARIGDSMRRKAVQAAYAAPDRDSDQIQTLALFLRYMEYEQATAVDPAAKNALLCNVKAMLDGLVLVRGVDPQLESSPFQALTFPKPTATAAKVSP